MYGALSVLARGAKRVRTAVQPKTGEEYGPAVIRFNPPDAAGDPWDNADRSAPKRSAPALRIVSMLAPTRHRVEAENLIERKKFRTAAQTNTC